MRYFFRAMIRLLLIAGILFCAILAFAPQVFYPNVLRNVNAFEAAQVLRTQLENNLSDNQITVLSKENVDEQDLFRTLEATFPYAFSLHCTTRGNGLVTIQVEIENQALQTQARLLADSVVQTLLTPEMSIPERLRVLHDYVVQHCAYDTDTADNLVMGSNGAQPPFTAYGMLVDGKAVCAGYARAYMMLCDAAGIDTAYIVDAGMNHGWNAVRVYDTIYYIDTTFDDPIPDRGDLVSTAYFLKTAEEFSKSHTWDTTFYDALLSQILPASLESAQRLFDAGWLSEPLQAKDLTEPLPAAALTQLSEETGLRFSASDSAKNICDAVWTQIQMN